MSNGRVCWAIRVLYLLRIRGDNNFLLWDLCDEHLGGEHQGGDGRSVLNGVDGHLKKTSINR